MVLFVMILHEGDHVPDVSEENQRYRRHDAVRNKLPDDEIILRLQGVEYYAYDNEIERDEKAIQALSS